MEWQLEPVDYDPFERAAERTRRSVRPEGGRQEGPATEWGEQFATGMVTAPVSTARDLYEDVHQGRYGAAAADAGELALMTTGPSRVLGAAARAAPGLARAAGAGLGTYLGLQPGKLESARLTPEQRQQIEFQKQQAAAQQQAEKARQEATLAAEAARAEQQRAGQAAEADLQRKNLVAEAEAKARAAQLAEDNAAQLRRQSETEEAARQKKLKERPFKDKYPEVATALPVAGLAASAMLPELSGVVKGFANNRKIAGWEREVERGKTAITKATAAGDPQLAAQESSTLRRMNENVPPDLEESVNKKPSVAGTALTSLLPVETSVFPQEWDFATQDADSPSRKAAAEFFTNPTELGARALVAWLGGLGATGVGQKLGHMTEEAMSKSPALTLSRSQGQVEAFDQLVENLTKNQKAALEAQEKSEKVAKLAQRAAKAAATRAANRTPKPPEEPRRAFVARSKSKESP